MIFALPITRDNTCRASCNPNLVRFLKERNPSNENEIKENALLYERANPGTKLGHDERIDIGAVGYQRESRPTHRNNAHFNQKRNGTPYRNQSEYDKRRGGYRKPTYNNNYSNRGDLNQEQRSNSQHRGNNYPQTQRSNSQQRGIIIKTTTEVTSEVKPEETATTIRQDNTIKDITVKQANTAIIITLTSQVNISAT